MEKGNLSQYWIVIAVSVVISTLVLFIGIFTQLFLRAPIEIEQSKTFQSVQELDLPQPDWTLYNSLEKKGFIPRSRIR